MNTAEQTNLTIMEPQARQLAPAAITPMQMLTQAVERGASVELMEKLMALHERWEANQARKAFDGAMAAAKAEIPVIAKNRTVDFTGRTGIRTHYKHEDLGEIARTVDPILAKHGLSYRFRTTANVNEPVSVTCIISHRDGHSEENTLLGPRDESGNKNAIQSVGSTITFLQRYTLKAALGLAASADDDGNSADQKAPDDCISADQVAELQAIIDDVGGADATKLKEQFLRWAKVSSLADIPAKNFGDAVAAIQGRRKQG